MSAHRKTGIDVGGNGASLIARAMSWAPPEAL
jgi:hypothetical protein